MKENEIIPTNSDFTDEEPSVLVIPRKSRRKTKRKARKRRGFLLLVVIAFLIFSIVKFLPHIQEYIGSILPDNDNTSCESDPVNSTPETPNSDDVNRKETYDFLCTFPTDFQIVNETGCSVNVETMFFDLQTPSSIYSAYGEDAPVILLTHFSPKEAYSNGENYDLKNGFYSEDNNVYKIGEYMSKLLNDAGINTLHLSYDGFASNSIENKKLYEDAVKAELEKYPSIAYVFDISRTLDFNDNLSINKPCAVIDDTSYPVIQLTVGTNNTAISDSQRKNIYFSHELSKSVNSAFPYLITRLVISEYPLSQNFDAVCIRIDIGAFSDSYDEVALSAQKLIEQLIEFINS